MYVKFKRLSSQILLGGKLKKFTMGIGAATFMLAATTVANAATAVTAATINMRTGPSVSYPVITAIPRGAVVEVYACLRSRPWCDVVWDGWRGWVSARYLRYTGGSYRYTPIYEIFPFIGIQVFTGVPVIYPRIRRPHPPRPPRPGVAPAPRPGLSPTVAPRIVPQRAPMVRPPVYRTPGAPMMAPRPAAPPRASSGSGGRIRLPGGNSGAAPPSRR